MKREFYDTFNSLTDTAKLEIAAYLKSKSLSEKEICARYGVTRWWLSNYKERLRLLPNTRNDDIINDRKNGASIDEIKAKTGLEESRVRQIINNHGPNDQDSKSLF